MAIIPDVLGALLLRLRADVDLSALTNDRISGALQDSWAMPKHAVVARRAGGPGGNFELNIQDSRVDFHCYGITGFEATKVWRTVHTVLMPPFGTVNSFKLGGCLVYGLFQEGGPNSLNDPDTNWPVVIASYIVRWSEIPQS